MLCECAHVVVGSRKRSEESTVETVPALNIPALGPATTGTSRYTMQTGRWCDCCQVNVVWIWLVAFQASLLWSAEGQSASCLYDGPTHSKTALIPGATTGNCSLFRVLGSQILDDFLTAGSNCSEHGTPPKLLNVHQTQQQVDRVLIRATVRAQGVYPGDRWFFVRIFPGAAARSCRSYWLRQRRDSAGATEQCSLSIDSIRDNLTHCLPTYNTSINTTTIQVLPMPNHLSTLDAPVKEVFSTLAADSTVQLRSCAENGCQPYGCTDCCCGWSRVPDATTTRVCRGRCGPFSYDRLCQTSTGEILESSRCTGGEAAVNLTCPPCPTSGNAAVGAGIGGGIGVLLLLLLCAVLVSCWRRRREKPPAQTTLSVPIRGNQNVTQLPPGMADSLSRSQSIQSFRPIAETVRHAESIASGLALNRECWKVYIAYARHSRQHDEQVHKLACWLWHFYCDPFLDLGVSFEYDCPPSQWFESSMMQAEAVVVVCSAELVQFWANPALVEEHAAMTSQGQASLVPLEANLLRSSRGPREKRYVLVSLDETGEDRCTPMALSGRQLFRLNTQTDLLDADGKPSLDNSTAQNVLELVAGFPRGYLAKHQQQQIQSSRLALEAVSETILTGVSSPVDQLGGEPYQPPYACTEGSPRPENGSFSSTDV